MPSHFFTNHPTKPNNNRVLEEFKRLLTSEQVPIECLEVLVAYFRVSGYCAIEAALRAVSKVRILIGINLDRTTWKAAQWQDQYKDDLKAAAYEEQVEQGILQFIADVKRQKVELRYYDKGIMHAKVYIFRPYQFGPENSGSVISGSSNLTTAGLGSSEPPNYEFNVLLQNYADVAFAHAEFEKLWALARPIEPADVVAVTAQTHLQSITPRELYYKFLMEYFKEELELDLELELPAGFLRLEYQIDAVRQAYVMLEQHNGFFLSDVVGLGKTVIALLIVQTYLKRSLSFKHELKVLLVTPPTLKPSWEETIAKFGNLLKGSIDFSTTGRLAKIDNAATYHLIIVDEAHKFRNRQSAGYTYLQNICKTPTLAGKRKKVILISATPLNNRPEDLESQVLLFQDGRASTLDHSISAFFKKPCKAYKAIQAARRRLKDQKLTAAELEVKEKAWSAKIISISESIRVNILSPLMIRRTRGEVEDIYGADLKKVGITFPEVQKPTAIEYTLDPPLSDLYFKSIARLTDNTESHAGLSLTYARYRSLEYLNEAAQLDFEKKNRTSIKQFSKQLTGLMKSLLLKRMDSSFFAFSKTLERCLKSHKAMLKMWENDRIIIGSDLNLADYSDDEAALLRKIEHLESESDFQTYTRAHFDASFEKDLQADLEVLQNLHTQWQPWTKFEKDLKWQALRALLAESLKDADNLEDKAIIFSESTETVKYLSEALKKESDYANCVLAVHSKNVKNEKETLKKNFDANIRPAEQDHHYRILLATEVLAEGLNLHRANVVINYDTPWNATKLMQRIGRVNRIGTKAERIYIYNFVPAPKIENQLQLHKISKLKMQAFHAALGEDAQVYSDEEAIQKHAFYDLERAEEQKNERLLFLEEVKQLKKNAPQFYQKLKNLPDKLRNTVCDSDTAHKTLVFLRTAEKNSPRLYLVGQKAESCYFEQAAHLLKKQIKKPTQPLQAEHYKQVQKALRTFEQGADIGDSRTAKQDLQAIRYLRSLSRSSNVESSDIKRLNQALKSIEAKQTFDLTRKINALAKKGLKEAVLNLVREQTFFDKDLKRPKQRKPTIVISQSYI